MKKIQKAIAIMLTVLTLMSVISAATPVLATEVTEITTTERAEDKSEMSDTEEAASDEPEILNEMVEWRTETTKYFRNSDGSYTAAQYAHPVHYKENGEWKEIDNTLTLKTVWGTEKEFVAENTNTPASFPEELNQGSNNEISVTAENYTIKFSPKSNKNVIKVSDGKIKDRNELDSVKILETVNEETNQELTTFKLKGDTEKEEKNEHKKNEKFRVENKSGAIVYEDVFNNVDLEYELNNSKLKESIVLNKKQENYIFSFNMDLGGLFPVMCEDGSINLCSDKEGENSVAKIEAPYMVDSKGEYSDAVTMLIEENGGEYILTVTADEKWLNDKSRVYPVIIDPTIDLQISRLDTIDCYVDNSLPSNSFPTDYYIYAGHSTLGKTRTFIKFNLPELPDDNCIITNAFINFWQKSADTSSTKGYLTIHEVTENWNNTTSSLKPTWNNQPTYNDKVLDYSEIKAGSNISYKFDITRTIKEWYEKDKLETNYGFLLKSKNESVVNRAQLYSAENSADGAYPAIYVNFRNNKGVEGYWDYSSFGVGAAGTAHVNDYTGNLVYELPIASSISEIMPVSIVGYYNNYCANELIRETEAENVRTSIGRGFRLNYQQTVLPSSKYGLTGSNAQTYPYVYTDGDGTEHYIQKTTEDGETIYKDEDGLGLTFTNDFTEEGTYRITDKANNKYYFNRKGNLFRIIDNNGNEINIIYKDASSADDLPEKSRIDKIIDGAGHTYKFTYSVKDSTGVEMDYVSRITDDAGREHRFYVSSGLLTKVTYPDGNEATFDYEISSGDSSEGRINAVYSNGIYELNFDYTSKKTGRRVKEVKEYGETGAKGQVITFNRSQYNTTIMRSCGLDGVHSNDDDIITTIQYDNMGRSISQQMKFGSGDEIGAGSCAYTTSDSDDTASGFKNKVSGSGATGKFVENLLYGGNAESQEPWAEATKYTITSDGSLTTSQAYMGKKSLEISNTSITDENAMGYFRQILSGVKKGETYTLSGYVKVTSLTPFSNAAYTGALIQLGAYNSGGSHIESQTSQLITAKTETSVNNGWRRLSTTITIPENTATLRVYLALRNCTGTAYFDCIQLEKGATVNDYNMLENGDFTDLSSGNEPSSWSGTSKFVYETGKNGVVKPSALPDDTYYDDITSNTFKITGSPDVEKGVSQTVAVEGDPNDTYILSGWAKGFPLNSTFHTDSNDKEIATFEIAVKVNYSASDGTSPSQFKTPASFNTTITDWQCASVPISLKYTGGKAGVTYTPKSIKIIPRYHNQENFVFFDKIMLVKDVASSYTYDNEGNIISSASNGEQKANMKYDDNNNLTSYTDTAGYETTAEYYSNNSLKLTKSAKGVYTKYNIDDQGNVIYTELRNTSEHDTAQKAIRTNNYYYEGGTKDGVTINEGAYKTGYRDENANLTSYTPDHKTGTLTKVKDAKGVETNYEYYGTFGKPLSVSTAGSKVTYKYNTNEQLNEIVFGTSKQEKYSFVYDGFGNVKQTLVGSQPLSTNTFKSNNGALEKTTYGNQDAKRYVYNNFGQQAQVYGTDARSTSTAERLLYSWTYNDSGVGLTHTDHVNGLKYIGDYDSLGRLSKETVQNSSDSSFVGFSEYGYDVRNNLTSLITTYGGDTRYQYYYYSEHEKAPNSATYAKDNLPTFYQLYYNSRYAVYDYDNINRLNQRMFSLDTPLYYNYIYKLSDRNASGENLYRTHQVEEEYIGNDVYIYGYDVLGNITSIKKAERKSTDPASSNFKEFKNSTDYATYTYDNLGQLTRENNKTKNKTTLWTYDELGNVTAKTEHAYTTGTPTTATKTITYGYGKDNKNGWNNLLVSVDENGNETTEENETITYDEIGNPTTYLGATLQWNGRQLTSYTKGDTSVSYKYDANGLRASKTVAKIGKMTISGIEMPYIVEQTDTKYYYVNGQLHFQDSLTTKSDGSTVVTKLYFYYDSYGYLSCIKYNGNNYYVATNQRGDVVALYYPGGKIMGRYEYDAWGNVTKITDIYYDAAGNQVTADLTNNTTSRDLLVINPIRYRGYYYDTETELYYLQSRYYNAEVGRFLNADGYLTTGQGVLSYNMFAYCGNNPVMYSDPSGNIPLLAIVGLIAVTAVGIYTSVKDYYVTPKVCEAVCDVSKDLAKTSGVKTTASICGGVIRVVGAGVSIYKAENARKEKIELMSQFSKDCYNAAFYSNTNTSYDVSYDNYSAFTLQTYNQIVQNSIPMYKQEIELFSGCYPDLGKCEWDHLSGETRQFIEGRFADANASAFVSLSTHYSSKGAIVP